jgi:TolA-binding protein
MSDREKEALQEGMTLFKKGDLDAADQRFRSFLKDFPTSDLADNACYNLAKIAMKRGQNQRALEWLEFLLENYPGSDAAYMAEDERIELQRAMGVGPAETADERYFKGKQTLRAGKIDEAEKIFRSFLTDYRGSDLIDNAHYNLAMILKRRGNRAGAQEQIDIILRDYPDSDAAIYAADLLLED